MTVKDKKCRLKKEPLGTKPSVLQHFEKQQAIFFVNCRQLFYNRHQKKGYIMAAEAQEGGALFQGISEAILSTVPDYIHVFNLRSGSFSYYNVGPYFFGHDLINAEDPLGLIISNIHPDDMEAAGYSYLKRISKNTGDEVLDIEFRIRCKDDSWAWALTRARPFRFGQGGELEEIITVTQNITEKKEQEIALKKSEALLKAILDALPDLKFRISADGVFLDYFASPGETDRLFVPPDQFLEKPIREVLPEYLYRAIMKNLQKAVEKKKTQAFEYPLMIGGGMHYFEARISAINSREAIVVVRDISKLKLTQQELQSKIRELDQNNQKLQRYVDSNLQLENFAHTVSHDLREPVRTINSFSQLLQKKYQGRLDEDADIFLDFIASSASSMNTLIEGLLEYSRFNNSEHEVEEIPVEQLLQAVANGLDGLIAERQAVLYICNPMPVICGNWTKISQLFQNLISNAIKFGAREKTPIVEVFAIEELAIRTFAIRDNGIGIKPEYQKQIFQLFRRLHSRRQYPGSGIGLALCKRVVEQHGGRIWVESEPGKGSTFYFTLPK